MRQFTETDGIRVSKETAVFFLFSMKSKLVLWKGSFCKWKSLKIITVELGVGEMTLKD